MKTATNQKTHNRPFEALLKPIHVDNRQRTREAIGEVYYAALRQRQARKVGRYATETAPTTSPGQLIATNEPTLPDIDIDTLLDQDPDAKIEIIEATPGRAREDYRQDREGWLRYFRDTHAPDAVLTIEKGKDPEKDYFRLVSYGANGAPEWVVGEKNKLGNATYIWRHDRSPNPVDQALGGTKGQAIQMSAERLYHPSGFDGTLGSDESDRFEQRLLDMLTREPQ